MNNRKRTPFGEATADIGNRANSHASTPSSKVQKPRMILQQAPPSSMRFPSSNGRSQSRPPQLGEETPRRLGTAKVADVRDGRLFRPLSHSTRDAYRAREYKGLAFEAGIRVASQEQSIVDLLTELEEVKSFQRAEFEGGSEAVGVVADQFRNDAELIEALDMELEIKERDLNQSLARVVELERNLIEARSESVNQRERWDQREAELTKQLERQKLELDDAIKDARDGVSIVRELDGALRSTRAERSEARSLVSTLRAEIKQMKDDAERMAALMKEMETEKGSSHIELPYEVSELSSLREEVVGLRERSAKYQNLEQSNKKLCEEMEMSKDSLQIERSMALSVLSSLREEVDGLRERLAKNQNLEQSNKELQSSLEVVQSHSDKKMNHMKEAMKGAEERERKIKIKHEKLRQDFLRQKNEMCEMKSAYNELSGKTNEVGKEPAIKTTLLSANSSRTEKLQGDLTMAQSSKAALDCKVLLTEVLSGKSLARSDPQETRNIEDDALKEYCLQRFG
jgi:chromosome segregation ATPase